MKYSPQGSGLHISLTSKRSKPLGVNDGQSGPKKGDFTIYRFLPGLQHFFKFVIPLCYVQVTYVDYDKQRQMENATLHFLCDDVCAKFHSDRPTR